MLPQHPKTTPAENRDFPEWHHGRETYSVWVLRCDKNNAIQAKFKAAREHLSEYLLESYQRQPHITLFVCGFLANKPKYNDDFTQMQLDAQIQALKQTNIQPFEIEIGGFNSFSSAPYLEVNDLQGGILRLREVLSNSAREFRTTTYTPHLTVGLYSGAFQSEVVLNRMGTFSNKPVLWRVEEVTLATYRAQEFAGRLKYLQTIWIDRDVSEDIPY